MAERITNTLWRLEIPLVGNPLKYLNSYLITGGDRSLLIDTGFRQDPCREAMERQLKETGVDRDRMDIFLTHRHSDHTGLAPELLRPGCTIFISNVDGPGVARGLKDGYWRSIYLGYVREGFRREEIETLWNRNPAQGAAPRNWLERSVQLRDGEELHYGGHRLRCILTPGHTPGHLCLYEPERKWLFSGDHILLDITPNICRWEGVPDSLGSYLHSLSLVRELPVERLFPGHRGRDGNLAQRVDALRSHHEKRLAEAASIVADTPGLTAYEIAGRMTWSIRCRDWQDFPLTQKYFAVGETLAHLDYLELRGQVRRRETAEKVRYEPCQ